MGISIFVEKWTKPGTGSVLGICAVCGYTGSDLLSVGKVLDPSTGKINELFRYQHYLLPLRTEMADYWSVTCIGNKAEIERLLKGVSHVGKKRKPGWGVVERWEIKAIASFELTRPRPADTGVFQSWTNPHWDDRLWRYCI